MMNERKTLQQYAEIIKLVSDRAADIADLLEEHLMGWNGERDKPVRIYRVDVMAIVEYVELAQLALADPLSRETSQVEFSTGFLDFLDRAACSMEYIEDTTPSGWAQNAHELDSAAPAWRVASAIRQLRGVSKLGCELLDVAALPEGVASILVTK